MTEKTLEEVKAEIWATLQENSRQLAALREQSKETDRQFQETDKKIDKLAGMFGNQWGRLMETLVAPDVARLFQERGVQVMGTNSRVKRPRNGETMEIDLLLVDDDELVVVEVKTTVGAEDVADLINDLNRFPFFFPEYRSYKVYGAIAGLDIPEQVGRQAYRRGLFVLGMSGQGLVTIINDETFKPKNFNS